MESGLKADDVKRLKELERENATLKRLLADAELLVESARGAVSALLPIRFPGPLAEPGVRVSTHRALHDRFRQAWFGRR